MNRRALVSNFIPITSLLLLMMFKFQNCAPVPNNVSDGSSEVDGVVGVVDRWQQQKIAFIEPSVKVSSEIESVDLRGLCVGSPKGQLIEYQVYSYDGTPRLIDSGQIECVGGGFELPVSSLNFASCGEKWYVRAARVGDRSIYAEAEITPDCPS